MANAPGISPGSSAGTAVSEQDVNVDTNPNDNSNPPNPSYTTESNRTDSPATTLSQRTQRTALDTNIPQRSDAADKFSKFLGFPGGYDFNYKIFPEDLGSDQYNHYMIINVNVQVNAAGERRVGNSGFNVNNGNFYNTSGFIKNVAETNLTNEYSKVDQLKFGNGQINPINVTTGQGSVLDPFNQIPNIANINIPRGTRRIKESIALFMPTPMVYSHHNIYEEISLTAFGYQVGKLGASTIGKFLSGAGMPGTSMSRSVLGPYGNVALKAFQLAGYPINPKLEVLFSGTPQRQFNMELLLAPKNEAESYTVKNIIDTLRYHAAPEIDSIAGLVPVFIPPSEFDITFYHKGKENTKIPRINTCALERVEVDYAPSGVYSTFTNGYPVTMVLRLAFRELEILHKMRVQQGF